MKSARIISTVIPTKHGMFRIWVWDGERGREPVAFSTITLDPRKEVLLRIHSECLTGDTFGSYTCDCEAQKEAALSMIRVHGNGIFIYHRQEGRNMGLFKKIQVYKLMSEGFDTHQAALKLANHPDPREYSDVIDMLGILLGNVKSRIRLLTNNPYKVLFLERHGYPVTVQPLRVGASAHNERYIKAKAEKFLHNSVGFGPYVGLTISRDDVIQRGASIARMIRSLDLSESNRKLFLGIPVLDISDQAFLQQIRTFERRIHGIPNVHVVLHLDYVGARNEQKQLSRTLPGLKFPYSLQFRLRNADLGIPKVDLGFLDSLHAEHLIFQLRKRHFFLLEQRGFADYFRSPNKFLLVDDSWGKGAIENITLTCGKLLKLIEQGLSRVAVAGGYDADSAGRVRDMEDYFKIPISVDAESKLRKNGRLDLLEAKRYMSFFSSTALNKTYVYPSY